MFDVDANSVPASPRSPLTFSRRTEPKATKVFDTYWRFAAERQAVYFRRLQTNYGPWTTDPILTQYKFTNAYRAADRVSQYLIRNVIYGKDMDARTTVFRVLLFKLFNKIETWELLESHCGPLVVDGFNVERFDAVLSRALQRGIRVYSAAYIMPNAPRSDAGTYKHRTHLELLAYMLEAGVPEQLLECKSMEEAYQVLLCLPSIGPFLAYQYVVDLAYSQYFAFSENEFVQPGPGALHGLSKCFSTLGEYTPGDAIRWVTERQRDEFLSRSLEFQDLFGRPLHLIDCQNLFCEVDKYARVAHPEFSEATGRSRIKQKFTATGALAVPFFPTKWKLRPAVVPAVDGSIGVSAASVQQAFAF